MHSKKSLLFHENHPWQKSQQTDNFDVTMGSFDGAETCELIGTYILNKTQNVINNSDIGLYRDDGLAVLKNRSLCQANRFAKQLTAIFQDIGLKITTTICSKVINFLDVTFNIDTGTYKPFMKPNNRILYVNKHSNHPNNIITRIPHSVNTRLSNISSDQHQFDTSAQEYQDAITNAGYDYRLKFENRPERKNKRTRKIIWYNPPFSKHVQTTVGKQFLHLIDKHFPKHNKLHKIFNRNTIKVSYSCMDNVGKIINAHNKAKLQEENTAMDKCNCKQPNECPLSGNCLIDNIVYKATVHTAQGTPKSYIGLCETDFKRRFNNHKLSFTHEDKKQTTQLSKHIWTLKNKNIDFRIKWTVLKKTKSYSNITKRCQLCLWEKYFIIMSDKATTLNKRSELLNKCRHSSKFLLKNL